MLRKIALLGLAFSALALSMNFDPAFAGERFRGGNEGVFPGGGHTGGVFPGGGHTGGTFPGGGPVILPPPIIIGGGDYPSHNCETCTADAPLAQSPNHWPENFAYSEMFRELDGRDGVSDGLATLPTNPRGYANKVHPQVEVDCPPETKPEYSTRNRSLVSLGGGKVDASTKGTGSGQGAGGGGAKGSK